MLTPILVTGMGRSGSTLAMQLLGTDPNCVFEQIYPLESRYLSLIAHFAAQWQGWTFADYGQTASAYQSVLGSNPVVLRSNAGADQLLKIPQSGDVLLSLWRQFSSTAREAKPHARFYGEKTVEWMPSFLAPYMDLYALYLFRDPRDLFLSANSFNSKRGYLAFGRTEKDSDRDHAITLAYRFFHRFENYKLFQAQGGSVSLVRYEDLALNPIPTLAHLMETTGIQIQPLKDDNSFSQHRTSGSIEQSINRWKREPIEEEVLDIFNETLFDVLTEIGYETSRPTESFDLNFSTAGASNLKSRISNLENAEIAGFDAQGMSIKELTTSGTREIALELDMNDIPTDNISEIWICLSGYYGGSLTIGWASGSSDFAFGQTGETAKSYDPGPHCTTLRFNLRNEENFRGPLSRLILKIAHKGPFPDKTVLNLRHVKLISKSNRLDETSKSAVAKDENTSGKKSVGGFFNQLLGVSKNEK